MTYYFFSMVPKVLLEAFDGIFYAHFLKNKLEIWGKAQRSPPSALSPIGGN